MLHELGDVLVLYEGGGLRTAQQPAAVNGMRGSARHRSQSV
jgi:hypothetical protein